MLKDLTIISAFLLICSPPFSIAEADDAALISAQQGNHRDSDNRRRDQYRHPVEVLNFFDVGPKMSIVEIWPSSGWWTEILGPYTHDQGIYYAAGFAMTASRTPQWRKDVQIEFANKLALHPQIYSHIVCTELSLPERYSIAPAATTDRVLTFRNVHNWMKGGYDQQMFEVMFRALKPGGILGLVEHRAKAGTAIEQMISTGYVTEAHIKSLAQQAGFLFDSASELNANPKDTTEHPKGVWTLPPTLRHCKSLAEKQQEHCNKHYKAIGESDRMTLRFIKPAST